MRLLIIGVICFLLSGLLVTTGCRGPAGGPERIVIGQPAPDFALADATGKIWRLSELRGKVVFVNFWATWCQPCREEMPALEALNRAMPADRFQMLSIAYNDDHLRAEAFARSLRVTFPVLGNPPPELGAAYMITGVPETFIIDGDGILRERLIGPRIWYEPQIQERIRSYFKEPNP